MRIAKAQKWQNQVCVFMVNWKGFRLLIQSTEYCPEDQDIDLFNRTSLSFYWGYVPADFPFMDFPRL